MSDLSNSAFAGFRPSTVQVVEQHPEMPGADVAAMYSALLAFSGTGKRGSSS